MLLYIATGTIVLIVCILSIINAREIHDVRTAYNYSSIGLFFVASVLCAVTAAKCALIISKNFNEDLRSEKCQLIICQSIFVASFLLRSVLTLVAQLKEYSVFQRDYPDEMKYALFIPL